MKSIKPKAQPKQIVEIHIYIHQVQPNYNQPPLYSSPITGPYCGSSTGGNNIHLCSGTLGTT